MARKRPSTAFVARRSRPRIIRILAQALCAYSALSLFAWIAPITVVPAAAAKSSNSQGFDSCVPAYAGGPYVQPSVSQMQTWWNNGPTWFNDFYVYIGGSAAFCQPGTSGVDGNWISQVLAQGWALVGIWAGPQCCGSGGISTNTTTAYNQGRAEGTNVINQLTSWNQVNYNFPLTYDLEPYSSSYVNAADAFIGGWVSKLHESGFASVGVYGSSCSSNASSWVSAQPVPDYVWLAWYANPRRNTAWGYICVSDNYWNTDQRHGQYNGTHSQTLGNVTLSIDTSCANGPIWAAQGFSYLDGDAGTSEAAGASEDDAYWCQGGVF